MILEYKILIIIISILWFIFGRITYKILLYDFTKLDKYFNITKIESYEAKRVAFIIGLSGPIGFLYTLVDGPMGHYIKYLNEEKTVLDSKEDKLKILKSSSLEQLEKDFNEFSKTSITINNITTNLISMDKGSYINIIHYIYIQYI